MLPKVELGRTGLWVSRLGYGALELRDVQETGGRLPSEEHAGRVLNAVLDAGINFIDTAPSYGRSEEFVGKYISQRREEYFLATKCGRTWRADPPGGVEWSRTAMLDSIDRSLRRLGTGHVDLLQLHGPTVEQVESYECVRTLEDIRAAGKARFIGVSAVLPDLDTFIDWGVFDTFQIVYSAFEPEHEAAISRAAQQGGGTIIRGGASKGVAVRETGRGNEFPLVKARWERSGLRDVFSASEATEVLLRYALGHPSAHTFIVGTQSLEHLEANARAVQKGPLDAETHELVRRHLLRAWGEG